LGRNLKEAIEITAARTGPGMLLSAVTAAATCSRRTLTDFRGVQELGFIAGTAILLAWVAMMTVFPATLVLMDRRHADRPRRTMPRALALDSIHVPFVERLTFYPKTVLVCAGLLTVVSAFALRSVQFDYNLLNLQARGTESVVWEKKKIGRAHVWTPVTPRSPLFPYTTLFRSLLTVVSAFALRSVQFDYNLLNLQARGTESVVWEKK